MKIIPAFNHVECIFPFIIFPSQHMFILILTYLS